MAGQDIKQLLLASHGSTKALFASQRDLARAIVHRSDSNYPESKEKSIAVFLNQILQDKRSCPAALEAMLVAVARDAAASHGLDAEEMDKQLRAALSSTTSARNDGVQVMYARQLKAQEIVIVAPETLEGACHPRFTDFHEAMVNAVCESRSLYTFLMDSFPAIWRWYSNVYNTLKKRLQKTTPELKETTIREKVEQQIEELEQKRLLLVILAKPRDCILPLVAFDPQLREYCDIYVWDWEKHRESGRVENYITSVTGTTRDRWRRYYYEDLVFNSTPDQYVRYRYVKQKFSVDFV